MGGRRRPPPPPPPPPPVPPAPPIPEQPTPPKDKPKKNAKAIKKGAMRSGTKVLQSTTGLGIPTNTGGSGVNIP
tara:strand:+ start:1463 stop:1684 length:222 start_codon:yes stop_codon:yes gene_type:complete